MATDVDVAVIGGGQAGLATSFHLQQAGVEHVVLEAGRVAETWRSRRWDSFCLVTPNAAIKLPGTRYAGDDPDGFMSLAELIEFFERWVRSFKPPVLEHCAVSGVTVDGNGRFVLGLPDRKLVARTLVVASGAYQKAHRPAGADALPAEVHQFLAEDYGHPDRIPPGNVLIVGSGQTGCQLAEELHATGRKVLLACGRCPWIPRRTAGRDTVFWMNESGFVERTRDQLPSPAARLIGNPQTTGHGGGRDLNYRTLHRDGVELMGRFLGAEEGDVHFADDLAPSVDFGDAWWAGLRTYIDAHCARNGMAIPDYDIPPPMRVTTRRRVNLAEEGVTSVIWTTGYRPEYGWVEADVFDDMGFPIQSDGRTSVPGLYFVGVHWMRKHKSAILYGVGEDAEVVARQIVGDRA